MSPIKISIICVMVVMLSSCGKNSFQWGHKPRTALATRAPDTQPARPVPGVNAASSSRTSNVFGQSQERANAPKPELSDSGLLDNVETVIVDVNDDELIETATMDDGPVDDPSSEEAVAVNVVDNTGTTATGQVIGTTVASLGAPDRAGRWIRTPLVIREAQGKAKNPVTGKVITIILIPMGGPRTAGSEISIEAMQALGYNLTDVPEIELLTG